MLQLMQQRKHTHAKSITTQTERKASAIRLWCQIETKFIVASSKAVIWGYK